MRRPEDELFATFQRTGDPETLGQVYDLVGAELLRVALHLTGGPAEAEDVLQSTFVAAIERADTYDPERPVRPWLLGILTNQAKLSNRRRRRAPDPDRLHERSTTEPDQEAWSEELDERVQEALATLSSAYQPVLVLHLRHGLSTAEIATALGRPPGTVRSQLARGLERLRQALPASFAGAALVAMSQPVRGATAVREAIVAHASSSLPTAAAAAATTWFPGVVFMKSALLAVGLTGAIVAGWSLVSPTAERPTVIQPTAVATLRTETVVTPVPAPTRDAVATPAAEVTEAATPVATMPAGTGNLAVRAFWHADDSPAADVVVLARVFGTRTPYPDERVAYTNASGVALFEGLPPGHTFVRLLRGAETSVTVATGQTVETELGIAAGMNVEGVVVDELGRGVPNARIWLSERWRSDDGHAATSTDGAGRFALRGLASDHYIGAYAPGRARSYVQPVRGRVGERVSVRIVLDREGTTLRGEVVDPDGEPVADAIVRLGGDPWREQVRLADGLAAPGPPPHRTRTDAKGRFAFESVAPGRRGLRARATGYTTSEVTHDVDLGLVGDVRIELIPEAMVTGRVVDAAGKPLGGVSIHTQPRHDFAASSVYSDWGGQFSLGGLPAGLVTLEAEHQDGGRLIAELQLVAGRTSEWNPVLSQRPRIFGVLVDHDGNPVERWHVVATDATRSERRRSASSDPQGNFSIEDLDPEATYTLWAQPPGAWRDFPRVILNDIHPGLEPLTIDVDEPSERLAKIRARVIDPVGDPANVEMTIWHEQQAIWRSFVADEETGEFRIDDVPQGTVYLDVRSKEHPWIRLGAHTVAARETLDLGTLQLEPSGTISGTIHGVDDAALSSIRVMLSSPGRGEAGVVTLSGRDFQSSPLAPGQYTFSVGADFATSERIPFEIEVGKDQRLDVTLRPAGMRRVVFDSGGAPVRGLWCVALDASGQQVWMNGSVQADESGVLAARVSLEPGTYRLVGESNTGLAVETQLTIRDYGYDEQPLQARLEPKRR